MSLTFALVDGDLSLRFVAEHITLNLARPYKAAAIWAGDAGRRVCFAFILSVLVALRGRHAAEPRVMFAGAIVVLLALAWALLGNPFQRLPWQISDGSGLDPSQQFVDAIILTPLALCALALLIVAAIAALDDARARSATPWLLLSWIALTSSLVLGARVLDRFDAVFWTPSISSVLLLAWLATTLVLGLAPQRHVWWPRSSAWRRILGGSLALATLCIGMGAFGRLRPTSRALSLGQGQAAPVTDSFGREWSLAQQGVSAFREGHREIVGVTLEGRRNATQLLLVPQRSQFVDSQGEEVGRPVSQTARAHGFLQSLRATLLAVTPDNTAQVRVEFMLFQTWLWSGSALLLASGIVAWLSAIHAPIARSTPAFAAPAPTEQR
jgi:cytochrome c biogenesis factor